MLNVEPNYPSWALGLSYAETVKTATKTSLLTHHKRESWEKVRIDFVMIDSLVDFARSEHTVDGEHGRVENGDDTQRWRVSEHVQIYSISKRAQGGDNPISNNSVCKILSHASRRSWRHPMLMRGGACSNPQNTKNVLLYLLSEKGSCPWMGTEVRAFIRSQRFRTFIRHSSSKQQQNSSSKYLDRSQRVKNTEHTTCWQK